MKMTKSYRQKMSWVDKGTILILDSYESTLEEIAVLTGYQEQRIKWLLEAFINTQAKKDAIKDAKEHINELDEFGRTPWTQRIHTYWQGKPPIGINTTPDSYKSRGNKVSYLSIPTKRRVRTPRTENDTMENKTNRHGIRSNSTDSGETSIIKSMKKHQEFVE